MLKAFDAGLTCERELFFISGSVAIVVLAWIGIFSIGGAYALIFVFGAEVMPTSVRSTGLSLASLFGKAGSVGGLYVAGLLVL